MEPLFFVPFFEEKHWGGNKLATEYNKYPQQIKIADSWEMSAVQFRQTFVRNGEYMGAMLSELYSRNRELFGTEGNFFPFIIKLLDVETQTPVIVHGGGMKKDSWQYEGWYIVSSDPESSIVAGTKLSNSLEFLSAIAEDKIIETSYNRLTTCGEGYLIPPGIPYSIGGGHLIYEISSPLREAPQIYDWGRPCNLSIDEVIDAVQYKTELVPAEPTVMSENIEILLKSDYFILERINAEGGITLSAEDTFSAFTALGNGIVSGNDFSNRYRAGETFMIPAGKEDYSLAGGILLKASPVK